MGLFVVTAIALPLTNIFITAIALPLTNIFITAMVLPLKCINFLLYYEKKVSMLFINKICLDERST
jgi:hypothetical protein